MVEPDATTPEEVARVIVEELMPAWTRKDIPLEEFKSWCRTAIEKAIERAVSQERDRCATVAEEYAHGAGLVNDSEGIPICSHCDGESVGFDISDRIRGKSC